MISYSTPRLTSHGTITLRTLSGASSSAESAGHKAAANTVSDLGVSFDASTVNDTTSGG